MRPFQDLMHEQMTVWDAEGLRVGVVSALGEHRFYISHGPALRELEANFDQVSEIRDDECFLNVRRQSLFAAALPGEEGPDRTEEPVGVVPDFDQYPIP